MAVLTIGAAVVNGVALRHAVVPHDTASPLMWYLTRALAVGAYISLTISMLLGALCSIARQGRERISWVVDELHQFLAALSGALVLGHIVTLLLDPFLPFSLLNVVAPMNEPYRPFAVALGVVGLYTIVVLLLTSWLRPYVPYKLWRALHYFSFIGFILFTAHGLLAGSDAQELWMRAIYAGAAGAFGFLTLMRLFGRSRRTKGAPAASPVKPSTQKVPAITGRMLAMQQAAPIPPMPGTGMTGMTGKTLTTKQGPVMTGKAPATKKFPTVSAATGKAPAVISPRPRR